VDLFTQQVIESPLLSYAIANVIQLRDGTFAIATMEGYTIHWNTTTGKTTNFSYHDSNARQALIEFNDYILIGFPHGATLAYNHELQKVKTFTFGTEQFLITSSGNVVLSSPTRNVECELVMLNPQLDIIKRIFIPQRANRIWDLANYVYAFGTISTFWNTDDNTVGHLDFPATYSVTKLRDGRFVVENNNSDVIAYKHYVHGTAPISTRSVKTRMYSRWDHAFHEVTPGVVAFQSNVDKITTINVDTGVETIYDVPKSKASGFVRCFVFE
jgi:hypothetical protein